MSLSKYRERQQSAKNDLRIVTSWQNMKSRDILLPIRQHVDSQKNQTSCTKLSILPTKWRCRTSYALEVWSKFKIAAFCAWSCHAHSYFAHPQIYRQLEAAAERQESKVRPRSLYIAPGARLYEESNRGTVGSTHFLNQCRVRSRPVRFHCPPWILHAETTIL